MFSISRSGDVTHVVSSIPSNDHAKENNIYVQANDSLADSLVRLCKLDDSGTAHRIQGVFKVAGDARQELHPGVGTPPSGITYMPVGLNANIRKVAGLVVKDTVRLERVEGVKSASLVVLSVKRVGRAIGTTLESDELSQTMEPLQGVVPSAPGQPLQYWPASCGYTLYRDMAGGTVAFEVKAVNVGNEPAEAALMTPDTQFTFEPGEAGLKIIGQNVALKLFKTDYDLSQLGIGGLDSQFNEIFRVAFASRAAPPKIAKDCGLQHTKGILLHGPPGTGKTLIARQIGKILETKEPKVVNGPEVLDKFVGESERKIRELFADAERDQAEMGDGSPLHLIIFDEIDALCRQRGTVGGGTGVHDSIVNTLLTKIDGVDALNNVLLIGMTNRPDLLDEALVRPGRMELKIEIGLPDEMGRQQILNIHTGPMRSKGYLDANVDVPALAKRTVNFTGAELAAVVRRATFWALDEKINKQELQQQHKIGADFQPVVTQQHFMRVLDGEIQPAFGAAEADLKTYYKEGILEYGARFEAALNALQSQIATVKADVLEYTSILLCGDIGTGKTALAAYVAQEQKLPFVKVVDFMKVMNINDSVVAENIKKAFDDAMKSPLSMLILDNISRLLAFNEHGPQFSQLIRSTLMSALERRPPDGKRLVVIATADLDVSSVLKLSEHFAHTVCLQRLNREEIDMALQSSSLEKSAVELVRQSIPEDVHMTIRKLTHHMRSIVAQNAMSAL